MNPSTDILATARSRQLARLSGFTTAEILDTSPAGRRAVVDRLAGMATRERDAILARKWWGCAGRFNALQQVLADERRALEAVHA